MLEKNESLATPTDRETAPQERPSFKTSRVFDAPKRLVFEAWSKAEHLKQWFPPNGFTMPRCTLEFRAGGVFSFDFRGPDGVDFPCEGRFDEIVPDERIVFTSKLHGDLVATATVTFAEVDGKTTLTVEQVYSHHDDAVRGAPVGWGQTLDHLAAFVANAR